MSEPAATSPNDLIDAASRRAAAKVILRARQTGTPVIVWEDGQIRHRSPDDFPEFEAKVPTNPPAQASNRDAPAGLA